MRLAHTALLLAAATLPAQTTKPLPTKPSTAKSHAAKSQATKPHATKRNTAPQLIDAAILLEKAIGKMSRLRSLGYSTTERQNGALVRKTIRQMGGLGAGMLGVPDRSVSGNFYDDVLHAKAEDEGEIVIHGRRTICGSNDGWKLQRNGSTKTFVFDPQLFFQVLSQVDPRDRKVRRVVSRKVKSGERRVITLTLKGDAAADLQRSGALPPVQSMMSTMVKQFAGMAGGAGGVLGDPEVFIDLAIQIDPVTGYVHEIRSASFEKSAIAGMAGMLGGGRGGGEEEEEEEEEEDEDEDEDDEKDEDEGANRKRGADKKKRKGRKNAYSKSGLPRRKLTNDLSRCAFSIRFRKHGHPVLSKLSPAGRRLLGLPKK